MSSVKEAFDNVSSLTVTNLNSLASSATAGWKSDAIDNTSSLFADYLVQVKLAAVNTAPANNQAFYLFVSGLLDDAGSDYATTGASGGAPNGSEGTLTFPSITASSISLPLLGVIPYTTQNVAIVSPVFSVGALYNGNIPPKFCLALLNYSGMTIAGSGNWVKVRGVYRTVA